jgi:chromosome segregation ATPase
MDLERIAKLEAQVEGIKEDVADVKQDIKELHSRITTGNRELIEKFEEKIDELAKADKDQHAALKSTMEQVKNRVDILEKWRWMLIGAAIGLGYLIGNLGTINKIIG